MEHIFLEISDQLPELPVFENNQVLTADQLNDAIAFLDQQDRATRNRLLGAGVACGMHVAYSTSGILVSSGCGLTTAGDLIVQEKSVTYTKIKKFEDPDGLYPLFKKAGQDTVINLYELVNDGTNTSTISDFFTNDKKPVDYAVVAYFENFIKDADICSADNCDNEGKRVIAKTRFLVISKNDLNQIKQTFPCCSNDYFNLPEIHIARPKLTGFTSFSQLSAAYSKAIDETIIGLDAALLKAEEVYASLNSIAAKSIVPSITAMRFDELFSIANAATLLTTASIGPVKSASFSAIVKALKDTFSSKAGIQYVYDFVKDVCEAYNEFKESTFDVCGCCLPDTGKFPKHLMLGELIPPANAPLQYRHEFCKSPILAGTENLNSVASFYYQRLEAIKNNFIYQVKADEEIRITPSKNFEYPLGERAIPYYCSINKLIPVWNYDRTIKFKQGMNLSYQSSSPLNSNLDKFSYFRIEGHIGKTFKTVLKSIDTQIRTSNLPIDIVALKLGSQFSDTDIRYTCNFEDLESQYRSIKALLICKNDDYKNYFNSVKLQAQEIGDIATLEKKSTKKSTRGSTNLLLSNTNLKENISSFNQPLNFANNLSFITEPVIPTTEVKKSFDFLNEITIAGAYDFGKYLNGLTFMLNSVPNLNLPESLASVDLENLKTIFDGYTSFASGFKKELAADTKHYSYFTQEEMLNYLYDMQDACYYDQLEELKSEYDRRVEEIKKQNLFSEYFTKNPGLDHNCGVPKGGTFIIVYQEQFKKTTPTFPATGFVFPNLTIETPKITTGSTKSKTKSKKSETAGLKISASDFQLENTAFLTDVFSKIDNLNLPGEDLDLIKKPILDKYFPIDPGFTATVSDFVVVADFYLPYRCSSDCMPVAYVFPEIPEIKAEEEKISLKLQKNKFCDDDKTEYTVECTPAGGSMEGKGITSNGSVFTFNPAVAGLGTHNISYKLASGQSASISVEVIEHADASFSISKTTESDQTTTIKLKNTSKHATQFVWNFGNGLSGTDEHPQIEYPRTNTDQNFTITLTSSNDVCASTATLEVTIKAIERKETFSFSIDKKDFAYDDKTNYQFKISPFPGSLDEIGNKDNLNLNFSGGALSFIPAKQKLSSNKSFQLTYGKDQNAVATDLNIVVPNASFKIKLQAARGALGNLNGFSNATAVFTSNVRKAVSYEWNLIVNGTKITTTNEQEISNVFKEPRSASISLTITILVDGVNSTRTSNTIDLMKLDEATIKSLNAGKEIDSEKIK